MPAPKPRGAARWARTALFTINCDTVGQMSCNPAIGGVAKGQIVREIDALGGAMGRAIDATGIQFRMLNRRKGPAMHSPRAQADKKAYQQEIKRIVEEQPGLCSGRKWSRTCWSSDAGRSRPARDRRRARARRRGVSGPGRRADHGHVLASLDAHRRSQNWPAAGPAKARLPASAGRLVRLGIRLARFKTGTPPRLNGRTIDYSQSKCNQGTRPAAVFVFDRSARLPTRCPVGSRIPTRRFTN